jgi:hypothetical protein
MGIVIVFSFELPTRPSRRSLFNKLDVSIVFTSNPNLIDDLQHNPIKAYHLKIYPKGLYHLEISLYIGFV